MPTSQPPTNGSSPPPRVAIVGAGPGGLASAVLLAARGVDVTVFERQPTLGGRTRRIELEGDDGASYRFDCGPTFFLMPHVLEEICRAAGTRLGDLVDLRRLDPMYRLVIGQPGGRPVVLDATQDLDRMVERISAIDPHDGKAFRRFIEDNRKKLDAAEPILRRPIRSALDLARPDALAAAAHIKPHLSVHQLLKKYFRHPAVQLGVSFQSKYLGMSPFDCPSLFTILPFIEYEYGIWHPIGGCNALMHGLARTLESLGGRVRLGEAVESLDFQGPRVTGVIAGGEHHAFDHVVLNADAAWALTHLVPEPLREPGYTDADFDQKKYSCSTYMLYLGLDREVDLHHHTIYTSASYKQNLQDIGRDSGFGGSLSEDPSFYVCNPSRTDSTLAPAGKSSLYVLVPTPNTRAKIDWNVEGPRLRERVLDQMRERLGLHVRPHIRAELALTPDDWRSQGIQFGATFNLAHGLDQMLHKRPQHKVPGLEGLWLVGGGTHPGSGLPVIFLSSQITSRLIAEELGLPDPAAQRIKLRSAPSTEPDLATV